MIMKRTLLLMVLALGMCSISMAQMQKELQVGEDGYKWYKTSNDGKEGALDMNGNTIVPCDYEMISYEGNQYDFYPKYFEVTSKEESEWFRGVYTTNGRNIIPTSRHYNYIHGRIQDGITHYTFEKKGIGCGVCDVNGCEVIFIEGVESISPNYEEGKFFYDIKKNKLWGIVDGNGKIIIQPQYKNPVFCSDDNFENKNEDTGEFLVVGSLASVTTTRNPLMTGDNSTYTSSVSSSVSTPSVKELFYLAYNTPDSEAQLKASRYQKVLDADPNDVQGYKKYVLNNLGSLFSDIGEKETAKVYYEAAIAVDPNYKLAQKNLKSLKRDEKLDRISNALSAFSEALGSSQAENTYNNQVIGGSYGGSSGTYSSGSYSSSSSSSSSGGNRYDMSEQRNYNSDKSTYGRYDSMLSAHFYGNRSATGNEVKQWQQAMRGLREKWTAKGKSFPQSANETHSTASCPSYKSHSH